MRLKCLGPLQEKQILILYLEKFLCNAIIEPHFDHACSAWYPDQNKKIKSKLRTI